MINLIFSSMLKQTAINPIIVEVLFVMLLIVLCSPIFLLWLYVWKKHLGSLRAAFKRSLINLAIFLGYVVPMIIIQDSYMFSYIIERLIFIIPIFLIFVLSIYWKKHKVEFFKRGKSLHQK